MIYVWNVLFKEHTFLELKIGNFQAIRYIFENTIISFNTNPELLPPWVDPQLFKRNANECKMVNQNISSEVILSTQSIHKHTPHLQLGGCNPSSKWESVLGDYNYIMGTCIKQDLTMEKCFYGIIQSYNSNHMHLKQNDLILLKRTINEYHNPLKYCKSYKFEFLRCLADK